MSSLSGMFPIEQSDLYHAYLREKEEILKHKWVLSQEVGKDVGYSYAQWDWIARHRSRWIEAMKASGQY